MQVIIIKWWIIKLLKTLYCCISSLETNQWNVHCFTPVYVVRVRWGTHSLIQTTETNTSIVNQLFLNSLAQNTAWNRISKYKIRSLHVVFQSMVCYQLGNKPTYKHHILLRLYHENIDITNITLKNNYTLMPLYWMACDQIVKRP